MNKCIMSDIGKRIQIVLDKINIVSKSRPKEFQLTKPRLVAVSKTKPKELIIDAYNFGQRHFGENYAQELVEKGFDSEILEKCKDIKWHYIGNLQRNKVNKIAAVPNIFVVETVDSDKLATALNNAWEKQNKPADEKLRVMVQINTSGEKAKNGIEPSEAVKLAQHVVTNCPHLQLMGLMTIGRFDHDLTTGPNPDFQCLVKCREDVSKALGVPPQSLELSMGMSGDYEHAIEMGSTNVRVGSSIFGEREYKQRPVVEPVEQTAEKMSDLKVN